MKERETIEIKLPKKLLYKLMLMAHEQDITLNQLIENILVKTIDEYKEDKITTHEKHQEWLKKVRKTEY
jgi:hypothetical protein